MESSPFEGWRAEGKEWLLNLGRAPSPAVKYAVIKTGGALRAIRRKGNGQSVAGRIERDLHRLSVEQSSMPQAETGVHQCG